MASSLSLSSRASTSGLLSLRPLPSSPLRKLQARRTCLRCHASSADSSSTSVRQQRISGNLFKSSPSASSSATDVIIPEVLPPKTKGEEAASQSPSWLPEPLTSSIMQALGKALKPALVSLLIAAVLWYAPGGDALAAQGGGRAGGSNFSASRSRSYSAPSRSYTAPSPRYSAPSPGFSAPFFMAPSPFFSPFGFGFGPTVVVGGGGFGFGGFFNFMLLSIVAFFVVSAILNFFQGSAEEEIWEASQRSSIVRLQVGLMGSARQLQKDLERMATRADTSTPEGLHYVLQEAVLSLLRNPDYCIYGYSTSEVTRDSYEGEQAFNRLSLEERSKFKEETLVNVGDVRKRVDRTRASSGIGSEYIVVTLIAATEGELRLPEIKSAADLRTALTELGSITADELQAIEILWTPENEEDTLTTKDMLQDYPLLRPL